MSTEDPVNYDSNVTDFISSYAVSIRAAAERLSQRYPQLSVTQFESYIAAITAEEYNDRYETTLDALTQWGGDAYELSLPEDVLQASVAQIVADPNLWDLRRLYQRMSHPALIDVGPANIQI